MGRHARSGLSLAAAIAGVVSAGAAACDSGLDVQNGRPRVTWAAVEVLDEGRAYLTLWLQDPEGDAVDARVTWSAGGSSGELALAPGSAPLLGLPTQLGIATTSGQAHRVVWDIGAVPAGAATLTIEVDDRPHAGDEGDAYRVEGLDPRVGGGPIAAVPD